MNVLADVRNEMSQRVPAQDRSANPANTADNIEEQIARIRHLRGTGDRRAERSHDGHKARENYGPATIFRIEIVSALEVAPAKK
jgi:hypothetical protein